MGSSRRAPPSPTVHQRLISLPRAAHVHMPSTPVCPARRPMVAWSWPASREAKRSKHAHDEPTPSHISYDARVTALTEWVQAMTTPRPPPVGSLEVHVRVDNGAVTLFLCARDERASRLAEAVAFRCDLLGVALRPLHEGEGAALDAFRQLTGGGGEAEGVGSPSLGKARGAAVSEGDREDGGETGVQKPSDARSDRELFGSGSDENRPTESGRATAAASLSVFSPCAKMGVVRRRLRSNPVLHARRARSSKHPRPPWREPPRLAVALQTRAARAPQSAAPAFSPPGSAPKKTERAVALGTAPRSPPPGAPSTTPRGHSCRAARRCPSRPATRRASAYTSCASRPFGSSTTSATTSARSTGYVPILTAARARS